MARSYNVKKYRIDLSPSQYEMLVSVVTRENNFRIIRKERHIQGFQGGFWKVSRVSDEGRNASRRGRRKGGWKAASIASVCWI